MPDLGTKSFPCPARPFTSVPIPPRMSRLPKDKRGYPIPWNIEIARDGTPLFVMNNQHRHLAARTLELCPICGQPWTGVIWFVGGPGSAFDPHGWYYDLPMHEECADYALQVCPYLAAPGYSKRIDTILAKNAKLVKGGIWFDPTQDPARPPLFVALGSTRIESRPPYSRPRKPYSGIWYYRDGLPLAPEEAIPLVRAHLNNPNWSPPL